MNLTQWKSPVARQSHAVHANVEAVILAAGRGSRLAAYTDEVPKCLVEVGGTPLIELQMQMLEMVGIDRVTVVTGYRADEVRRVVGDRARFIHNDAWNDSNSLYSLSLCRGHVHGAIVVMNCDVLVHPLVLQRLLDSNGSAFIYDSASGSADEHMKVELVDGRLSAMSKTLNACRTQGENVGILYFQAKTARLLFGTARNLVAQGQRNMWMAAAVESVASSVSLRGVDIADLPWIEIDFPDDLDRACAHIWRQVASALAPPMRLTG